MEYNEAGRVLYLQFSNKTLTSSQKQAVYALMEETNFSLVFRGMLPTDLYKDEFLDIESYVKSKQGLLGSCSGKAPYHKFRRFDKVGTGKGGGSSFQEQDHFCSMSIEDFFVYLDKHNRIDPDNIFSYYRLIDDDNPIGEKRQRPKVKEMVIVNATEVIFYMIDVDMSVYMPKFNAEYLGKFQLPEILPAGELCLMSSVCNKSAGHTISRCNSNRNSQIASVRKATQMHTAFFGS